MVYCKPIYCKIREYPVYTFVIEKADSSNTVVQIESNAKSEALDYFFDSFSVRLNDISNYKGYYFDENGNIKEMDLRGELKRRLE